MDKILVNIEILKKLWKLLTDNYLLNLIYLFNLSIYNVFIMNYLNPADAVSRHVVVVSVAE